MAFALFDRDHNGQISFEEMRLILERLGENCSVDELTELFLEVDTDGDGSINFDEFKLALCGQ